MDTYPTRRVDRNNAKAVETLGSKPKFWFNEGEKRLLFKAEDRGTGEDWAEVVSCHICELLGMPHVEYELARDRNRTIMAFAKGGRSALYRSTADLRPLSTIEAFQAFGQVVPEAKKIRLNRLGAVNREALCGIIDKVPQERMSEICRKFTLELLLTNQRRLLESR